MRSALKNTNGSVMVLLGAGASVDAGVLDTRGMIIKLNKLFKEEDAKLAEFALLYESLKKLFGEKSIKDGKEVYQDLNIEQLVAILEDLVSLLDRKHSLSPLLEPIITIFQSMHGFAEIKNFKTEIENQLIKWIAPDTFKLEYIKPLLGFVNENPGAGLKVFTLNYDKCIETAFKDFGEEFNVSLERGFGKEKQGDFWKGKNFEDKEESKDGNNKYLFLYKLHGSIDWDRNIKQELICANTLSVNECIFGSNLKVRTYDPFLYFTYQFRTCTLNTKVIIVCGYNFSDKHINDILHQALVNDPKKKILICKYFDFETNDSLTNEEILEKELEAKEFFRQKLELETTQQIEIIMGRADHFFNEAFNMNYLETLLPEEEDEEDFYKLTSDSDTIVFESHEDEMSKIGELSQE